MIIEQCHLDNQNDRMFCDEEVDMYNFARGDAVAVAKYFGLRSNDLGVDYKNYDLVNVDTALQYGEVHNDPQASESTPPGPLPEGVENPEFDGLREALAKKDPVPEDEIVTIEMPEFNILDDTGEIILAAEEAVSENEIEEPEDEGPVYEDNEAMMERLRRDAALKEEAEAAEQPAVSDTVTEDKKDMVFPAIVFAVLLLAVMLILAFARDK